jgi:hypothetical protein
MKAKRIVKDIIKKELKEEAKKIRELKNERKKVMYGYVSGLDYAQEDYRRKHVAYCMYFNNTPYEKIESNPKVPLYKTAYDYRISSFEKKVEAHEDVCISA